MHFSVRYSMRYFVLLSLTIAFSVLTASCSENKISQCNKIIKVTKKAVDAVNSITNGGQESNPKAMLQAAETMEKASQEMKSLKVKDEKLQNYQSRFVNMYRDTSKATREFVAAFEKKDRASAEIALLNVQRATTPEKQLVTDINTYCSDN